MRRDPVRVADERMEPLWGTANGGGMDGAGEVVDPDGRGARIADSEPPNGGLVYDVPFRTIDALVSTPLGLLVLLLRRARLIVLLPLTTALAAVAFSIAFREYTAQSRFAPERAGADLSRVAGLAAQFGFSVPRDAAGESADFYVDLLESGEILRAAVLTEYRVPTAPQSADTVAGTLLGLLAIEGDTQEARVRSGIDVLRERTNAAASIKSGLVSLETTLPSAPLAEAVNARMLEILSDFDRVRRQQRAQAERAFVEERLAGAGEELAEAETALSAFLDRNRQAFQSPRLTMESARLERQVALRQQVYASLAQAYEQARIEEVRNTPIITVVDRPWGSARPGEGPIIAAAIGLSLGFVAALGLIFALEYLQRQRGTAEMAELRAAFAGVRPVRGPSLSRR